MTAYTYQFFVSTFSDNNHHSGSSLFSSL